ncbi:D-2-hydroxyacid dehydrogenase [Haloarcula nitratireducens]|uniref:D-2-hydroxyacid dehydrogenase n=1 Tax=Haloarcula nitratireducens TaxID=2487749 RepID=A0AAW4PIJ5_9EURY|nr:D-2-hydroxyacid dehydrogenase [Halomicroarcula nitratireducens]MBX0297378.1 D-2-hydroxyacid dehydrogenase [Halomicroarcula nitratireducens]
MTTVLVYHDLPISKYLMNQRAGLTVRGVDTSEEALLALPDADVFVTNPSGWEDRFLAGLDRGDWVQATSSGYTAFPVETFRERGITFTNATGNYDAAVSEHVFALAFALSRGLPTFIDSQREHDWQREHGTALTDWTGKTMTIVGLGSIGNTIAERALAFGMDVYGTKRSPDDYEGVLADERVIASDDWRSVLPETDLLVLTVPLTPDTRGMVAAAAFDALPDSAVLVNVARGPIVDEAALVDALEAGDISGAGLDVFETEPLPPESPLWELEDVIITPHVGGRSAVFVERFADLFLDNYDRRRAEESLRNAIVE